MCSFHQTPSLSSFNPNSRYHYGLVLHPEIHAALSCNPNVVFHYWWLVHDEKWPLMSTFGGSFLLFVCISICFPRRAGSCSASSAFNTFTSAVTSTQRLRSLSVCLLLTVHCVISGSFQCDAEICKSALLVLSISDRIILKQRAACLPVCPLLLPQLIRLTEALHVWPQQLFQAFLQYRNYKTGCQSENLNTIVKYSIKSEVESTQEYLVQFWGTLHFGRLSSLLLFRQKYYTSYLTAETF